MRARILSLLVLAACDAPPVAPVTDGTCPPEHVPAVSVDEPAADPPARAPTGPAAFVVHEWGTFTTVAGADGKPLNWRPLIGKSELPGFVYRGEDPEAGNRGKDAFSGTVRMETPVIYFYTDRPRTVALAVGFERGGLTEWFPQAKEHDLRHLDWGRFFVEPAVADNLARMPEAGARGHYFAARDTDAAVVRVPAATGADEHEKFLFYRGVGNFALPLRAGLDGARVVVAGAAALGTAVVFERRGARVGYSEVTPAEGGVALARPDLDDDVPAVMTRLERLLVADGLYEREARAMTATWREHWFEDGLRVFYLLPRAHTDALLPLRIDPAPDELARTIVVRAEVITPELEAAVRAELAAAGTDARAACRKLQARHGRFAQAVLLRLLAAGDPAVQAAAIRVLEVIDTHRDPCVDSR